MSWLIDTRIDVPFASVSLDLHSSGSQEDVRDRLDNEDSAHYRSRWGDGDLVLREGLTP